MYVFVISHESIVAQATYQLRHKNTEYYSWVSSGPKCFRVLGFSPVLLCPGCSPAFPRCSRTQGVPVIPFFLKLPRCSRGVPVAEVFSRCSRSTSARSQGVPNVGTPSYSVPVQRQPVPKVFPRRSHVQGVPKVFARPSPDVQGVPMPKASPRRSHGVPVPNAFP